MAVSSGDLAVSSARSGVSARALTVLFLGGCVLAGLLLRLSLAARSGLWGDEALFLFIVHSPSLAAMLHFLHYQESQPPLFYLLMRAWQAVFGPSEASA